MFFKPNLAKHRLTNSASVLRYSKRYYNNRLAQRINSDTEQFDFSLLETIPFFDEINREQIVITPFSAVTNNKNYKVSIRDKHYILRVPETTVDQIDSVDRYNEKNNLDVVIKLGVYPAYIYFDTQSGIQLRPYIEGVTLTPYILTDTYITSIANIFKKTHRSQQLFAQTINLQTLFNRYKHLLEANRNQLNFSLQNSFRLTEEVLEVLLQHPADLVPSHFDPHPGNFIKSSQKLFLLDWEFSGNADPAWDLAFFSTSASLTEEDDDILLTTYYGNQLSQLLRNRMLVLKPLAEFFVAARMACIVKLDDDEHLQSLANASLAKTASLFDEKSFQASLADLKKGSVTYHSILSS